MAGPNVLLTKTFIAGADIAKNTMVVFDTPADTVIPAAAATDLVIGVAQHAAVAGERVEVALIGIAEIKAGGVVTQGEFVVADSLGEAVAMSAAATIKMAAGQAMATAADGDIIPVLLNPYKAVTA